MNEVKFGQTLLLVLRNTGGKQMVKSIVITMN